MGYTNGSAYTLTADLTGPATVANAQYYAEDVYTKVLTAAAKLKVTDVTVESGGTMTVANVAAASSATFSKITVGNSGSVTINNSHNALEFTVLSGGSLYTGNGVKLYNAVISSGAKWSKTNLTQIGGSATNIEQGVAIANNILGANFFVKDGVASNIDLIKHKSLNYNSVAHFYAIGIDNATVNSGASMILSLGVVVSGGLTIRNGGMASAISDNNSTGSGAVISRAVVESGGSFWVGNYVYANNVQASSGALFDHAGNATILGGSATNIEKGAVVGNPFGADFYVSEGVAVNMSVTTSRKPTFYNHLKASGGGVYAGGTMTLMSAGSAEDFTVSGTGALLYVAEKGVASKVTVGNGGYVSVFEASQQSALGGAHADAVTVLSGGSVRVGNYNYASGLRVSSGASAYTGNWVYLSNAQIASGAKWSKTNVTRVGGRETNIELGVIYGYGNVMGDDFYISNGVVRNLNVAPKGSYKEIDLYEVTISGGFVNSGGQLVVSRTGTADDAEVYDLTVRSGGKASFEKELSLTRLSIEAGGSVSFGSDMRLVNLDAAAGAIVNFGTGKIVNFGGDATAIAQGVINNNILGADFTVAAGVGTGLSLASTYGVRLLDGFTVSGAEVRGWITIGSGGAANGGTVSSGGVVYVQSGGVADGMVFSAGATLNLSSGGTFTNGTLSKGAASVEVSSGAVFDGNTIHCMVNAANGAVFSDLTVLSGGSITLRHSDGASGATANGMRIYSGGSAVLGRGTVTKDLELHDGATAVVSQYSTVDGATVYAGGTMRLIAATANNAQKLSNITLDGGALELGNFHRISGATLKNGGTLTVLSGAAVSGAVAVDGTINAVWGATVTDAQITGDAKLDDSYNADTQGATIAGKNTNIVAGGLRFYGADTGATVKNGVVTGLGVNGEYYRMTFGEGIIIDSAKVNGNGRLYTYGDAMVFDLAIIGSSATASVVAYDRSTYYNAVLTRVNAQAQLNLRGDNQAYETLVGLGTLLRVDATAKAYFTTIMAGGSMEILTDTATVAGTLTLDYTGAAAKTLKIDRLDRIDAATEVSMKGVTEAGSYGITATSGTLAQVTCANGLYRDVVDKDASYTNGIAGLTYSFDGTVLTAVDAGIAAVQAAAKLADGATTINNGDKAAKWDSMTTYSTNVYLAEGMMAGNAWLDIDGFSAATANLYGAAKDQDFAGTVNIGAKAGTIKNLAAGAALGGSVAGVKLTVGDGMSVKGAVYAGGMGDVTGKTETLIKGGTFSGNVFAGALCNYAANATATSTGAINLTVTGGTFSGNIYAGAAVKAGAATEVVHSAGNIEVELVDGEAAKDAFCLYGGGYATGTVEDAPVYTAGQVRVTVDGGEWGTYLSGRGIFGGAYADKVAASVRNVNITIGGGKMGNVYAGGWAQNGGKSTVTGGATIFVTGDAEIANVFGGGSYSSVSGGSTSVGRVHILVYGGAIYNNIFAAGQGEFSTVTGDIDVTFSGSNDYGCNVYGYGVQESATAEGDKILTFDGYTGALSGDVGGFTGITFAGDTAATLSGATIDNEDWCFDYTDRTLDAATAMLTLDNGSLAGDKVAVVLSTVAQVADGWNIAAGLTAADATYSVELATGSAGGLALGDALGDAYGIYEGWGFTLEDSTLKFKNLA